MNEFRLIPAVEQLLPEDYERAIWEAKSFRLLIPSKFTAVDQYKRAWKDAAMFLQAFVVSDGRLTEYDPISITKDFPLVPLKDTKPYYWKLDVPDPQITRTCLVLNDQAVMVNISDKSTPTRFYLPLDMEKEAFAVQTIKESNWRYNISTTDLQSLGTLTVWLQKQTTLILQSLPPRPRQIANL